MNPRKLPEVVANLIMEMQEVQLELRAANGRLDRLEQTMEQVVVEQRGLHEEQRSMREDIKVMPDRTGVAIVKLLESSRNRLLDHDVQLKMHNSHLGHLENPTQ